MTKSILIISAIFNSIVFLTLCTRKANSATFEYKNKLVIQAPDYKTAAKLCFKKLNPVYTTEEVGLDIIDICSNPVKGGVK